MNKEEVLKTHSIVTAKKNIKEGILKGDEGILSCYTPSEQKFIVHYNNAFVVMCETEKSFLSKFSVTEKTC